MLFDTNCEKTKGTQNGFKHIFRSATFWANFSKKKERIDVPKIRTYDLQLKHYKVDNLAAQSRVHERLDNDLINMYLPRMGYQRRRILVKLPQEKYYDKEIQQCQEMYSRLQLDKQSDYQLPETQFPLLRSYTMVAQHRPPTYSPRKKAGNFRPFSIRSAPAFMFDPDDIFDDVIDGEKDEDKPEDEKDDDISESSEVDESGKGRKRCKMDTEKLSDHLQKRGLGLPSLVKTAFTYRSCSQKVPKNMRSKSLPKNPSSREKIKGRARLDQEMANMRALAFCEQQAPKVFRSASANMKNRDVQFMEEELKENMQREVMDINERDDDDASIVVMPIKQEELFLRIAAWIQDVENASRSHHAHVNVNSSDDIVNQTSVPVT